MKFAAFLKHAQKSIPEAAADLGVTVEAVRFWAKETKIPSAENMVAIYTWSKGAVEPNDFYALPVEEEEPRVNEAGPLLQLMGAAA